MSTKTTSEKVSTNETTTWGGKMEGSNNTGYTITNVAFEHCCSGVKTVTVPEQTMLNNGDTQSVAFTTKKGKTDYWFVSFIDQSGNLLTGSLTMDFHQSSEGTTVEISLNPTSFTVTIGNSSETSTYFQKAV